MSVLSVISFQGNLDNSWVVFKHPNNSFNTSSKLIVGVGQAAVVVHGGKVDKIFESGTFEMDNLNLPFLGKLQRSRYGGRTPFTMEVYFINRTIKLDMLWGTIDPIILLEPKFNVKVNVRARGQFGLRITNYQLLITQLVGSLGSNLLKFDTINDFFRGVLNTKIKTILAKHIINNKVSVLDINLYLEEVSKITHQELEPEFEKFGFNLINFYYSSINIPDNDLEMINKILTKNAEFDILGDSRYRTSRGYDVLESAAKNEGQGGLVSAGVGLGLGSSLAKDAVNITGELKDNQKPCVKCSHPIAKDAKFCNDCGTVQDVACVSCNNKLEPNAKFCSKCGTVVGGNK